MEPAFLVFVTLFALSEENQAWKCGIQGKGLREQWKEIWGSQAEKAFS